MKNAHETSVGAVSGMTVASAVSAASGVSSRSGLCHALLMAGLLSLPSFVMASGDSAGQPVEAVGKHRGAMQLVQADPDEVRQKREAMRRKAYEDMRARQMQQQDQQRADRNALAQRVMNGGVTPSPLLTSATSGIEVAGRQLRIPMPAGFVVPTAAMKAQFGTLTLDGSDQRNMVKMELLPENLLEMKASGQAPKFYRGMSVSVSAEPMYQSMSAEGFRDYRRAHENVIDRARKAGGTSNASITDLQDGRTQAGRIEQQIESIHARSDRMLGFSTVGRDWKPGAARADEWINTTMLVHAGGRVLTLMVSGGIEDLDWSREMAKVWAEHIIALNP